MPETTFSYCYALLKLRELAKFLSGIKKKIRERTTKQMTLTQGNKCSQQFKHLKFYRNFQSHVQKREIVQLFGLALR